MDLRDHFIRMAQNALWANERIYRTIVRLRPGEWEAPRTSFFPSIRATLNHILSVDLYYLDMLEEGGAGLKIFGRYVEQDKATLLAQDQAATDRRLLEFCRRLGEQDMERRVVSDRGEDGEVPERVCDVLAHLFQHDIHHRGQVHAMLSGTSVQPPQLDEFFLDFDARRRDAEMAKLKLGS